MKRIFQIFFAGLCISAMSCSGNNSSLQVTLVPSSAVLIPAGTSTLGATNLTGPYFTVSSMNLLWKGTGTLNILAIEITFNAPSSRSSTGGASGGSTGSGSTSTTSGTCSFGGDDIMTLFPSLVNNSGVVVINQGQSVQASGPFGCSSIPAPVPVPPGYTLTGNVQVVGASIDSTGNTTGRVIGTATITVQ